MGFDDFTDRLWTVTKSNVPHRCQETEEIKIEGTPDRVLVQCSAKHAYGVGKYFEAKPGEPEKIEREKDYRITITARRPKYEIEALFLDDLVGGSWTAEDNTPGPGDG